MIILMFCTHYVACHILYQANRQHSTFKHVKSSLRVRITMRMIALMMIVVAIGMLGHFMGLERGLPIGIALFSIAGTLHVLVNAFWGHQRVINGLLTISKAAMLLPLLFISRKGD